MIAAGRLVIKEALITEDDLSPWKNSRWKALAPKIFWFKSFNTTRVILSNVISATHTIFTKFGQNLWGSTYFEEIFTYNKSLSHFCLTKLIAPIFLESIEYAMMQERFLKAHRWRSRKTAADSFENCTSWVCSHW